MLGADVSEAARGLAAAIGAGGMPAGTVVRFAQSGRMRQDGASRWMSFRARQTIAVRECGFDWRARTGPGGLVAIQDALIGGEGRLKVRLAGLVSIARAEGSAAVTRGELLRYLAELPWAPHAILGNPALRWRREEPGRIVVGAGAGERAAEVAFTLDAAGRVAGTFAPDRPRAVGSAFVPTPWIGRFFDYVRHDGLWLPSRAEVGWIVRGSEEICFEGRISRWRVESGA